MTVQQSCSCFLFSCLVVVVVVVVVCFVVDLFCFSISEARENFVFFFRAVDLFMLVFKDSFSTSLKAVVS